MSSTTCLSVEEARQKIEDPRYVIDGYIGEGGMACVYRAHERNTPNRYAIKLLRDEYREKQTFLEMFESEAANMRDLQYPNIVRFYKFVRESNSAYIVMEYVDGLPLSSFIRRLRRSEEPFPLDEAVRVMAQIARAIEHIHTEGYIHRDIKPGNVLLQRTNGTAYLTDMGIMSALDEVDSAVKAGTAYYMPYEQQVNASVDCTVDVYAFAVMLYEMLAGERLFSTSQSGDAGRNDLIEQHRRADVPLLSEKRSELPAELDTIFQKALAKKPASRYQSAMQFAQDIHSVLQPQLHTDLQNFQRIQPRRIDPASDKQMPDPVADTGSDNRRVLLIGALALLLIVLLVGGGLVVLENNNAVVDTVAQRATDTLTPRLPSATLTGVPSGVSGATDATADSGSTLAERTEAVTESADAAESTLDTTAERTPERTEDTPTENARNTDTPAAPSPQVTLTDTSDSTDPTPEITPDVTAQTVPASATVTSVPDTATPAPTATPTLTPTTTPTSTATTTPTATATPTPIPTAFLSGEPLLYIVEGVDLTGRGAALDESVTFALQEQGAFVPLRLGDSVNGFRVDMRLKPSAPAQMQSYGVAFRVQSPADYYRFRVDVASSLWLLEQVEDDRATVIERGLIEGDLPQSISVSGRDEFIRIEYAEARVQQRLTGWQQGGVALWLETNTPDTSPLESVQAGLLGNEAVVAADNPPTQVPPLLPPARLLLNDVRTLQSAGGADAIVDCGVFTDTYDALERFDDQPDIADTAQRARQVSAIIYNRCLLADGDSELDFNASLSDYLAWENDIASLARELEAE